MARSNDQLTQLPLQRMWPWDTAYVLLVLLQLVVAVTNYHSLLVFLNLGVAVLVSYLGWLTHKSRIRSNARRVEINAKTKELRQDIAASYERLAAQQGRVHAYWTYTQWYNDDTLKGIGIYLTPQELDDLRANEHR